MSSSETGGLSASNPSQPNGYTFSYSVIASRGTLARHTPWKPSQPAMKSHVISWLAPSFW
jgi:hypothetical protein